MLSRSGNAPLQCRIVPKGDSLADRLMRETGRQLEAERSLQQADGSAAGNTGRAACKMAAASGTLWAVDFMSDDSRDRFDFVCI